MRPMVLLLIVLLFIGGCAHYTAVPTERRAIGSVYSVRSSVAWSQADEGGIQLWTIDGPLLEALGFLTLNDGDTLFPYTDKDVKLPRFRNTLLSNTLDLWKARDYPPDKKASVFTVLQRLPRHSIASMESSLHGPKGISRLLP